MRTHSTNVANSLLVIKWIEVLSGCLCRVVKVRIVTLVCEARDNIDNSKTLLTLAPISSCLKDYTFAEEKMI